MSFRHVAESFHIVAWRRLLRVVFDQQLMRGPSRRNPFCTLPVAVGSDRRFVSIPSRAITRWITDFMHVTRISTTEELERLAPDWNRLSQGIPFRTWQWLLNWWKHYNANKSLYTLAVRDDDGILIGVAPWFMEDRRGDGRVIQFLGSGHVCTEYLTILATPGQEEDVVMAITAWLVKAAADDDTSNDHWDLLDFDAIPVGDEPLEQLVAALHVAGCSFNRRPAMDCWRMNLPATWDEFSTGLTGSHARQIRRVRRRLFDGGRGVVRTVHEPNDLALGMRIFVDLHQLRWTSQGEPGCFASAEFHGFMHACASDLLDADMLNLNWLEVEGRPVAAEFLLSTPRTQFVYQGGLDPASRKDSPGHALMSTVFLNAIDASCKTMDFLRGDEPYKATWGAQPFKTERIRVAPDRLSAHWRNHAWFAGQVMKQWVKQGLTLTGVR